MKVILNKLIYFSLLLFLHLSSLQAHADFFGDGNMDFEVSRDTIKNPNDTINSKSDFLPKLKEFLNLQKESINTDTLDSENDGKRFQSFEGLTIHSIRFIELDPFNVSIRDTVPKEGNFLTNTANSLHVNTHEIILKRQIYLKTGDILTQQSLLDNERLLRELPYIEDARIIVEKNTAVPGTADIIIITKDLWSKAFYLELKDVNAGKLAVFDKNIFGSGFEIQNIIHWRQHESKRWGYEAFYKNPNVLGSFINSNVYYLNVFDTESFGYSLERKFYTQDIKYAGGSNAYYLQSLMNVWLPDSGYFDAQSATTNYFDAWIGRSFLLKEKVQSNTANINLVIASRIITERFSDRPLVEENIYYRFHNKTLWLSSVALSKQTYFKSNLIYNFGRTEDIPRGYLINLTMGPEFGEFANRLYSSVSLAGGKFFYDHGYLYSRISFGTFFKSGGIAEQGVLDLKTTWYTDLMSLGRFNFRNFVDLNYMTGFNRFQDDKLFVNDEFGIRGFPNGNINGDQKLIIKLESDAFIPGHFLGFRVVAFGFSDIAFLGDKKVNIFDNKVFAGLGMGFRIKNERLAFPAFQLRFAFYPNLKDLSPQDMIRFMGEERFQPGGFNLEAPSLINFR
jgi:hypothetical protein